MSRVTKSYRKPHLGDRPLIFIQSKPSLSLPTLPPSTLPPTRRPAPILPRPTLPTLVPAQFPPREPDYMDELMAMYPPRTTRTVPNSVLGQKRAMLGDTMGLDNRKRPEIRRDGDTVLGNVDGKWKPAEWHDKIRDDLILLDAQQPGAPDWQHGMSSDYTSYSPFTSGWTADPASIRDEKGRQVCLMDEPPADFRHNPPKSYLMSGDKVLLDINNRPIKHYEGAPLSISTDAEPWVLEGLYRTLGMTIMDMRARMRPIRDTRKGPRWIQCMAEFANRRDQWKKDKNLPHWHKKESRQTKEAINSSSGVKTKKVKKEKTKVKDEDKDKQEEKPYSMAELIPTQLMDIDVDPQLTLTHLLSATPRPSSPMPAPSDLMQHAVSPAYSQLPRDEDEDLTEAMNMYAGSYFGDQPSAGYMEQSLEDPWTNEPNFPAANMPVLSMNPNTRGSINASSYPSQYLQQSMYASEPSSAMTASNGFIQYQTGQIDPQLAQNGQCGFGGATSMHAGFYTNGQPTTEYVEQTPGGNQVNASTFPSTNMPAHNPNHVGPGSINASRYPVRVAQQNIYPERVSMSAGSYSYNQPTTGYGEQRWGGLQSNALTFSGVNTPPQNANSVGSRNMTASVHTAMDPQQSIPAGAAFPPESISTYITPITKTKYKPIAPKPPNHHAPAPTLPIPGPTSSGVNQRTSSIRYEVDEFWDMVNMDQVGPPAPYYPAPMEPSAPPAVPRRLQSRPPPLPTPARPAESPISALISPADDPFAGAESSQTSPAEFYDLEDLCGGDRW